MSTLNLLKRIYHKFTPQTIQGIVFKLPSWGEYLFDRDIRHNPEIIARIDGGLASQMHHYILGQEIQRITGKPVSYDLTWYEHGAKDILGQANRHYELEKIFPQITVPKASHKKIEIYRILFNKHNPHSPNAQQELDALDLSRPPIYLGSYWKSTNKYSNYQLDNLRKTFTLNLELDAANQQMLDKIRSCACAVALQIRQGDFIGSIHDIVTPQYFYKALELIVKHLPTSSQAHFFVFSNGMDKSKKMLSGLPYEFTFVDINDNDHGAYDMRLMTECRHFIISNSGFGYWPALLSTRSDKKIVIMPSKHTKIDRDKIKPKYPGWVYLDC